MDLKHRGTYSNKGVNCSRATMRIHSINSLAHFPQASSRKCVNAMCPIKDPFRNSRLLARLGPEPALNNCAYID